MKSGYFLFVFNITNRHFHLIYLQVCYQIKQCFINNPFSCYFTPIYITRYSLFHKSTQIVAFLSNRGQSYQLVLFPFFPLSNLIFLHKPGLFPISFLIRFTDRCLRLVRRLTTIWLDTLHVCVQSGQLQVLTQVPTRIYVTRIFVSSSVSSYYYKKTNIIPI